MAQAFVHRRRGGPGAGGRRHHGAAGVAAMEAADVLVGGTYARRPVPSFRMTRHLGRALLPILLACGLVLIARALEEGERTLAAAGAELAALAVVAGGLTAVLERSLLRGAAGYVGRPRGTA